jgi:osmoprotectant transport system permease protein
VLIGNQGAFGNLLTYAQLYRLPRLAVTSVVTTAVLAIVIDALLVLLRRALTPWQPPSGRAAGGRSGATSGDSPARTAEGAS